MSVAGLVSNCVVIRPAQPVTPEGSVWKSQSLVLPLDAPSGNCDVGIARFMVTDELEGWQQVIIGGHDHSDVVVAIDRKCYEVDRQGDVDTLLLGRRVRPVWWISKCSGDHRCSVGHPASGLLSMSSVGARSFVWVRTSRIDPHGCQSIGCSTWAASACDETPQLHWVEVAILTGLRTGEKASAGTPVRVLRVYKQGEPQGRRHDLAFLRRQKITSPSARALPSG